MQADAKFSWGPRTVLLVDDEPGVRSVAARTLRNAGILVMEAGSGADALELVSQHDGAIHLLVTDMLMRGMNGHALAAKLREKRPELLVLYMSGYSLDQLNVDVDMTNAGYLEKPFAPAELLEKVNELLHPPAA